MNSKALVATLALAALLAACRYEPGAIATAREVNVWADSDRGVRPPLSHGAKYVEEIRRWQDGRAKGLRRDTGWLTLTGLFWLDEGDNTVGSGAANKVRLPETAPTLVGTLARRGTAVTLTAAPGAMVGVGGNPVGSIEMKADTTGDPTIAEVGSVQFFVIQRGDRVGVRVRDRENPALQSFRGLEFFPVDEKWRVVARFEPYEPPKQIPIQNIVGLVEPLPSPGALVFTIDGREYRLDPIIEEEGATELFVIFADATSGSETYGAGRYTYVEPPGPDGTTILDFNKAYNPPCAFTDFATCPLPPRQNKLPIRIEAGEKAYHH
ncbi:MAG TPA: DUF1684 domain-containing protein [Thermoanaerobaculia bacterium]